MKNYFFSLVAFVVAIALAGFTSDKKNPNSFSDVYFRYTLTTYSESQVENPSSWDEVLDFGTCDNADELACSIKVDHTTTFGLVGNRHLKASTIIVAAQFGTSGKYYVTTSGSVLQKKNKLE